MLLLFLRKAKLIKYELVNQSGEGSQSIKGNGVFCREIFEVSARLRYYFYSYYAV